MCIFFINSRICFYRRSACIIIAKNGATLIEVVRYLGLIPRSCFIFITCKKKRSGNGLYKPVWTSQPLVLGESLQMKTPNKVFTSRTEYAKSQNSLILRNVSVHLNSKWKGHVKVWENSFL